MKEEEYKTENNAKRDDYTNLSFVYGIKLFALIIVVAVGIIISPDFKSLLITAFTFFIGVIFDFIVIIKQNKGPKIKVKIILAQVAMVFIASGIAVCIVCMIYLLDKGDIKENLMLALTNYIRAAMICGLLSPVLERSVNKPNDD